MNASNSSFTEGLLTPRKDIAEKSPGVSRSELLTSQRLRRIEGVYLGTEGTASDRSEAADEIGTLVRHTLSFGSMAVTKRLWSKNDRLDSVETNCFGHTIVASELLERIAVPHTISFANGHSFITIFDTDSSQAHMVDPPSKELFIDMTNLIQGENPLAQLGRTDTQVATNILDTDGLMSRVWSKSREDLIRDHPWLSHKKPGRHPIRQKRTGLADTELILRTYGPATGRQVLSRYGMVSQHMHAMKYETAADEMTHLIGLYPEIDTRNKLSPATRLRHELGRIGAVEAMQDVAATIDSSLWYGPNEDKTTNRYFWFDTIRTIGVMFDDPEIVERARDGYASMVADIPAARHKVDRTERMVADIRRTHDV